VGSNPTLTARISHVPKIPERPDRVKPKAVIFDAYGTLLDVHSIVTGNSHDIDAEIRALSTLWRQRQLEDTWLRSLMDRYQDFWQVTETALRTAARQLRIPLEDAQHNRLMEAYLFPSAFQDVKPALESLAEVPLAILSNGTMKMLESAVRRNGLASFFSEIISVDSVRTYKPSPRVYALGVERLRLPAAEILFVSSNAWDASGAKAYGYRVCWCNRFNEDMAFLEGAPDLTVTRLDEIATRLKETPA
jgi:2-haloacid dehalogenase